MPADRLLGQSQPVRRSAPLNLTVAMDKSTACGFNR